MKGDTEVLAALRAGPGPCPVDEVADAEADGLPAGATRLTPTAGAAALTRRRGSGVVVRFASTRASAARVDARPGEVCTVTAGRGCALGAAGAASARLAE
ncbi:hypothetical protein I6A60_33135 [Frankia sp. AgB1.9]|uniref:hypothetical protein n=1 Tax=unclassified Frankia TaxID=2632575 RepID=UPI001932936A|nr:MULTISPECIES: hypothetical protein [unclassified Frankia]MBL7489933.1 hypothetical protein [Frankia sp. AgW1.1]MBL7552664.1 hypothetical protein [Frankia sp. AgB1.9]MBL7623829.1 hypothetical protein [Frankia sp. AgB1.8]